LCPVFGKDVTHASHVHNVNFDEHVPHAGMMSEDSTPFFHIPQCLSIFSIIVGWHFSIKLIPLGGILRPQFGHYKGFQTAEL
jgi:hypothetical protein